MKKHCIIFIMLLLTLSGGPLDAQTNMFLNNSEALKILAGDYNPDLYRPAHEIRQPDSVRMDIIRSVDRARLISLLTHLETFYNRNSGADTLSLDKGIGACRSWILSCFDQAGKENGSRLVTGYLEFDADICGMTHHKNPFALLPGLDTTNKEIIVIEGHFDTRNEERCDTQGYTPGMDDNGSGTVLVMELARVLSKYAFNQTILFTTPTGEDEGLFGAKAWADYLAAQKIKIRAVLNNDLVGGIYCGKTSPQPSCPYWGHADSTHVRIFSYSPNASVFANSPHKQLARYMKYIQHELINPYLDVPVMVKLYLGEDRSGRGGDHTPFRQKGYPAIRIISANENGDGTGTPPDRNHTIHDVLGKDINGDNIPDSLFVNPGYLARNAIMNGVTAALLASSPPRVNLTVDPGKGGAYIKIDGKTDEYDRFIVGVRKYKSRSVDFDTILIFNRSDEIRVDLESGQKSYISLSPVRNGAPALFSNEYEVNLTGTETIDTGFGINIHQNYPNPWNHETRIRIEVPSFMTNQPGTIILKDLIGRKVMEKNVTLNPGETEIPLESEDLAPGIYAYSLESSGVMTRNILMVKN